MRIDALSALAVLGCGRPVLPAPTPDPVPMVVATAAAQPFVPPTPTAPCSPGARVDPRGVASIAEPSSRAKVDDVMRQLERGTRPIVGPGVQMNDGWQVPLPSGRIVNRSQLLAEARYLATFGQRAVPALLDWAGHASLALRYVAIGALREITGISPDVFYGDADDGSRARAIAMWREGYSKCAR